MTYEEALKVFEDNDYWEEISYIDEACITAIPALEKQIPIKSKYERCPNCNTDFSFITKNLANPKDHETIYCWNCGQAIDAINDPLVIDEGYEAGKMAIEALQKQIPKAPINIIYDDGHIEYWNCPYCHIQHSGEITLFCDNCGQALD